MPVHKRVEFDPGLTQRYTGRLQRTIEKDGSFTLRERDSMQQRRIGEAELFALLDAHPRLASLTIRGCMTVPPFTEDPEGARACFRRLRELRDQLRARSGLALPELSMGMSHDFEVAIEEGSTCVRVGTAIFGSRTYPAPYEEPAP